MTTWVLLRGVARESRHWGAFPRLLQRQLPAADRVLAVDLPGNGARWEEPSPLAVQAIAASVRAELGRAQAGPYALVALSLGGMVAVEWAAQAPQEVRACILVNSSMGRLSPPWQRLRPASYGALLRGLLPGTPVPERERLVWAMTSGKAADAGVLADWVAFAHSHPVRGANVLRQLLAAARYLPPRRLGVPALAVASRGDRLVSPRCSQALAQAWQLPLVEHPWAGHDLPLDDPEWLAEQVAHWYARWFGNWPRGAEGLPGR